MPDWLNWIATGLSVACAIYSWLQAKSCNIYASKAEKFDEIDKLEQISTSCKTALTAIERFGPGATPEKVAGLDFSKAAEAVRSHMVVMREHGHVLEAGFLDSYCETLESALNGADRDAIASGQKIFGTITQCLTEIGKIRRAGKKEILSA